MKIFSLQGESYTSPPLLILLIDCSNYFLSAAPLTMPALLMV